MVTQPLVTLDEKKILWIKLHKANNTFSNSVRKKIVGKQFIRYVLQFFGILVGLGSNVNKGGRFTKARV